MFEDFKWSDWLRIALFIALFVAVTRLKSPIPQSANEYAKYFRDHFECHMVLKEKDDSSDIVVLTGKDLKTNRDTSIRDTTKWILINTSKFNVGDTVLKDRGKYTITIKSKGKKTIIPFVTGGKVYPDGI